MASQLYKQFLYSNNAMLSFIEGSFMVGASGAVAAGTTIGSGVSGITKAATGQYRIKLTQNFNRFLGFSCDAISPTSAAGLETDGSLTVGRAYQIRFASTSTNWFTLGLPAGLTAIKGMPFVATSGASKGPLGSSGVTAAGNGTVVAIGNSGLQTIELLPNMNTELYPTTAGAYLFMQTLNGSGVPTSPTSGTVLRFNIFLRNSSIAGTNETSTNY